MKKQIIVAKTAARVKVAGKIIPLALIMYLDKSQGFYPIENGYLIDTYNFFGFGKKIEYNVFDQNLRNKIAEIKSW